MKDIEWFMEQMKSMTRVRDLDSRQESWYISEGALLEALSKLDEPEVLSQEWIDGRKVARISNLRKMTTSDVVPVEDLESLIVPKEQTSSPVIPSWFANWFEDGGYEKSVYGTLNYLYTVHKRKMNEWAEQLENGHAELQVIIAGICDKGVGSYTVEEKKYRIHFGNHKYAQRFNEKWLSSQITDKEFASTFTKEEIIKLDNSDLYWNNFAEEATE